MTAEGDFGERFISLAIKTRNNEGVDLLGQALTALPLGEGRPLERLVSFVGVSNGAVLDENQAGLARKAFAGAWRTAIASGQIPEPHNALDFPGLIAFTLRERGFLPSAEPAQSEPAIAVPSYEAREEETREVEIGIGDLLEMDDNCITVNSPLSPEAQKDLKQTRDNITQEQLETCIKSDPSVVLRMNNGILYILDERFTIIETARAQLTPDQIRGFLQENPLNILRIEPFWLKSDSVDNEVKKIIIEQAQALTPERLRTELQKNPLFVLGVNHDMSLYSDTLRDIIGSPISPEAREVIEETARGLTLEQVRSYIERDPRILLRMSYVRMSDDRSRPSYPFMRLLPEVSDFISKTMQQLTFKLRAHGEAAPDIGQTGFSSLADGLPPAAGADAGSALPSSAPEPAAGPQERSEPAPEVPWGLGRAMDALQVGDLLEWNGGEWSTGNKWTRTPLVVTRVDRNSSNKTVIGVTVARRDEADDPGVGLSGYSLAWEVRRFSPPPAAAPVQEPPAATGMDYSMERVMSDFDARAKQRSRRKARDDLETDLSLTGAQFEQWREMLNDPNLSLRDYAEWSLQSSIGLEREISPQEIDQRLEDSLGPRTMADRIFQGQVLPDDALIRQINEKLTNQEDRTALNDQIAAKVREMAEKRDTLDPDDQAWLEAWEAEFKRSAPPAAAGPAEQLLPPDIAQDPELSRIYGGILQQGGNEMGEKFLEAARRMMENEPGLDLKTAALRLINREFRRPNG
ncbi:hypothetical protein HYU96_04100 [Candidatus Daviesbacteria bacterium]|nr:hypothetical protein [Candidatus Daviesbacteria bacterium]